MNTPLYRSLEGDIHCIDALYGQADIACCYLLGDGDEWMFIETGTSRSLANITATLQDLSIDTEQIRYVVPTHVHLDHAGGAGALMAMCPNATLLIHPRGARHMIDPGKLIASAMQVYGERAFNKLYDRIMPVPRDRVSTLEDGDEITLGGRKLRVAHTRGHAEHHFCLFDEVTAGWFSGDMYGVSYPSQRFSSGDFVMPATTPTQFEPELYKASVQRLVAAQPRCFYLTHFGELAFAERQAEQLLRQLDGYAQLATDSGVASTALTSAVTDITRRELATLLPDETASACVERLAMDIQLNVQGIAWYRQTH